VHGEITAFENAVDGALIDNKLIIGLGDYVDRGEDSAQVMELVLDLVDDHKMIAIVGNHDDKTWRYLNGNDVNITHGIETTIRDLADHPSGDDIGAEWHKEMPSWPMWITLGDRTFVHGGYAATMNARSIPWREKKTSKNLASRALFGKTTKEVTPDGYAVRSYEWIAQIPRGHTVYIGHDARPEIETRSYAGGGNLVMVDTGAGKGGKLSWVDINF